MHGARIVGMPPTGGTSTLRGSGFGPMLIGNLHAGWQPGFRVHYLRAG